ncbi:hypothetical protein Pint_35475 [Pistacia integerrima]|uniref:Uncharacterized protein n=1 Tax=Pistacia integerrima TaxID=434235 RepID=A0ACC0Y1A4_9ROSI|nr:hypothetical protein Pint_35475 [Pistacia integerrima]
MGIIAGAMMVATYQCISFGCCYYRRAQNQQNTHQVEQNRQQERPASTSSSSTIRLMPVLKYSKECNEETCCVCLCEFKDGEQIRVLPECLHLFHVVCIDMWLSSHSNCPLCRADTVPRPQHVVVSVPDSDAVRPPDQVFRVPDFGV